MRPQKPLLINYNAGILMTNGMLWNIHKISRYGDTYMILDNNVLKFNGDLAIEKVNVSKRKRFLKQSNSTRMGMRMQYIYIFILTYNVQTTTITIAEGMWRRGIVTHLKEEKNKIINFQMNMLRTIVSRTSGCPVFVAFA